MAHVPHPPEDRLGLTTLLAAEEATLQSTSAFQILLAPQLLTAQSRLEVAGRLN